MASPTRRIFKVRALPECSTIMKFLANRFFFRLLVTLHEWLLVTLHEWLHFVTREVIPHGRAR